MAPAWNVRKLLRRRLQKTLTVPRFREIPQRVLSSSMERNVWNMSLPTPLCTYPMMGVFLTITRNGQRALYRVQNGIREI